MKMSNAFKPGLLLSETHFPYLDDKGVIPQAIDRIAEEGFYLGVEIADVIDAYDRKKIGQSIRSCPISLTLWLTRILNRENLNLSSLDEIHRRKSVGRLKEYMEQVVECGATKLGIYSGPDPGQDLRSAATRQLFTSLCELCECASTFGNMQVLLEPIDRDAHKNALIGPTSEAVSVISEVYQHYTNVGLCWDSAHIALCGEDILKSLAASSTHVIQMHLSNAVLDRSSSDFGDHHMPTGSPGFLTIEKITEIFREGLKHNLFGKTQPYVAVEARTQDGDDPWVNVEQSRKILTAAWSNL